MAPERVRRGFFEEEVESADEYENFAKDNFDPTEPDKDVVEEPDDYNDIEAFDKDDVGVLDDDEVDESAVFEPDPDDFGPDELDPDADDVAEANNNPGDEDPLRRCFRHKHGAWLKRRFGYQLVRQRQILRPPTRSPNG